MSDPVSTAKTDPLLTLRQYLDGVTPGGLYPILEAREALAELERRQAVEARLHAALAKKREFHLVAYPHASPYVEVWRKGGRFSITIRATLQQALEDAIASTEGT